MTRYSVPAALCVTLLTASPGIAAVARGPEQPPVSVTGQAVPGSDALLAQVQSLGAAAGMLEPVTDLLSAVLKSPDGKVSADELAAVKAKIEPAFADLKKSVPAAQAPAKPVVNTPAKPANPPADPAAEPPVAKPADPVAKPPVAEPAKPADPVAKPPVAKPAKPADPVAKPPVAEPAKPADPVAKPPVAEPAKPADPVAKPPAAQPPVAQPPAAKPPAAEPATPADPAAKPPAAQPATPPTVLPAVAPKSARVEQASAAIDKLKGSVDGLLRVAEKGAPTADAKAKATMVVTDLSTALVAVLNAQKAPAA
ncbi:hypothetical protein ACFY15_16060 [Streptomyces sp. NPDC001373]|uniref:hypothetical protein n=1 Tax=Streptomyces sp. NPDC001373 TaxID=3364565 RepID=UPI0036CF9EF8